MGAQWNGVSVARAQVSLGATETSTDVQLTVNIWDKVLPDSQLMDILGQKGADACFTTHSGSDCICVDGVAT